MNCPKLRSTTSVTRHSLLIPGADNGKGLCRHRDNGLIQYRSYVNNVRHGRYKWFPICIHNLILWFLLYHSSLFIDTSCRFVSLLRQQIISKQKHGRLRCNLMKRNMSCPKKLQNLPPLKTSSFLPFKDRSKQNGC